MLLSVYLFFFFKLFFGEEGTVDHRVHRKSSKDLDLEPEKEPEEDSDDDSEDDIHVEIHSAAPTSFQIQTSRCIDSLSSKYSKQFLDQKKKLPVQKEKEQKN